VPELPEVETVRRSLEPALYDGEIVAISTSALNLRRKPIEGAKMKDALVGARFTAARRHGKYLMLDTSAAHSLVVHLGMAGRLLLEGAASVAQKHTRVAVALSSGRVLRFVDPRRFGFVRLHATAQLASMPELAVLGPDPLAGVFEEAMLHASLVATRRDLKSTLLDQSIVAGLGNIYVSEALFEAGLSPRRRADRLSASERASLYGAIRLVLERGVANRGTSFSDYVDADGNKGGNQHLLKVYGRTGEACLRCDGKVRRIVQAQRSTFYCPRCQRAK